MTHGVSSCLRLQRRFPNERSLASCVPLSPLELELETAFLAGCTLHRASLNPVERHSMLASSR